MSDGAAAVVLRAERAPRAHRGNRAGDGHPSPSATGRISRRSGRPRWRRRPPIAWRDSAPSESQVAELHDAFTPFELLSLEDTGLVPPGKSGRAILDGDTTIGGRLPVNPSGGLKARGHPLAATGVSQMVELVWQLRGLAEGRQVDARVALAQSIGGLATNNWVALLEGARDARRAGRLPLSALPARRRPAGAHVSRSSRGDGAAPRARGRRGGVVHHALLAARGLSLAPAHRDRRARRTARGSSATARRRAASRSARACPSRTSTRSSTSPTWGSPHGRASSGGGPAIAVRRWRRSARASSRASGKEPIREER